MKYRKKPVVIEAIQYRAPVDASNHEVTGGNLAELLDFVGGRDILQGTLGWSADPPCFDLVIKTLEGFMTASPGDFIIKGVKNEFYPCKADIFAMTYDLVEDAATKDDRNDAIGRAPQFFEGSIKSES